MVNTLGPGLLELDDGRWKNSNTTLCKNDDAPNKQFMIIQTEVKSTMKERSWQQIQEDAGPIPDTPRLPGQEDIKKTTPQREWEIKKLQEQFGVAREIAEKMVDESHGRG